MNSTEQLKLKSISKKAVTRPAESLLEQHIRESEKKSGSATKTVPPTVERVSVTQNNESPPRSPALNEGATKNIQTRSSSAKVTTDKVSAKADKETIITLHELSTAPTPKETHEPVRTVQVGTQIAVLAAGEGTQWASEIAAAHPELSLHIVNLGNSSAVNQSALADAVSRTGKVLILHPDATRAAEISATIAEQCFSLLDGPIVRVSMQSTAERRSAKEAFARKLLALAKF